MSAASRYERLKASWLAENPSATPSQYAAAMRAIARKAGL